MAVSGPFKYPSDKSDRYRSKIQFQAIKVIPPELSASFNFASPEAWENFLERATTLDREREQERAKNGAKFVRGGNVSSFKLDILDGERCDLYLPISYQVSDRFTYETPTLNIAGATTLGGLQNGQGLVESTLAGLQTGVDSITQMFTSGFKTGDLARLAAVRASNSFLGKALPQSVRDAISIAANVSVNPNVRAAFRGVGLRRFTFNFKFIPKSSSESEEVRAIIRFFREHAYPEEIAPGGIIPLGYKYPDLFKIKLMHQGSTAGRFVPIGTAIKLSYLESISTNYNPTSATFHSDGRPVEIDLSLNFVEYKTLSRKDMYFDDVDYDPDLAPVSTSLTDTEGSF